VNQYPRTKLHFDNNAFLFGINFAGPLSINVGPFFPFHPLYFLFSHSSQITFQVQRIGRYIGKRMFRKMRGGVNKEEVKKIA
jgi:hypothetical protein